MIGEHGPVPLHPLDPLMTKTVGAEYKTNLADHIYKIKYFYEIIRKGFFSKLI